MSSRTIRFSVLGIVAAGLGLTGAWPWLAARIANGDASAETVALGETLYGKHCAACHGANLEGQRDWKSPLPSGRMPAPPHDESGHTWHHNDRVLFGITKYGLKPPYAPPNYESDMPAFAGKLSDEEIRAVLAYISSHWISAEVLAARAEIIRNSEKR